MTQLPALAYYIRCVVRTSRTRWNISHSVLGAPTWIVCTKGMLDRICKANTTTLVLKTNGPMAVPRPHSTVNTAVIGGVLLAL